MARDCQCRLQSPRTWGGGQLLLAFQCEHTSYQHMTYLCVRNEYTRTDSARSTNPIQAEHAVKPAEDHSARVSLEAVFTDRRRAPVKRRELPPGRCQQRAHSHACHSRVKGPPAIKRLFSTRPLGWGKRLH